MTHDRNSIVPALRACVATGAVLALLGGAGIGLGGCTPVIDTQGHLVSDSDVAALQKGMTSEQDVLVKFGTPSTKGAFAPNIWMYLGTKTSQRSFFRPDVTEHKALLIEFDDERVVRDYIVLDKSALRHIKPLAKTTPTVGYQLNALQQILGNIGRFQGQKSRNSAIEYDPYY